MASVTATRTPERPVVAGQAPAATGRRLWIWPDGETLRWGRFSLSRRILFVNLLAIGLLAGGMLYLGRYERGLIDTEILGLRAQGAIFAGALAEGAVLLDWGEEPVLAPSLGQGMVRRLTESGRFRARLYLPDGRMIADSRTMHGSGGVIEARTLAPPGDRPDVLVSIVNFASGLIRARGHYPPETDPARPTAADFTEVGRALGGQDGSIVRADGHGGLVLSVSVPVKRYKQVLGALQLSANSEELDRKVDSVRADILRLFLFAVVVTALLSLYLASTIVRPMRRLAAAAAEVRRGQGRKVAIPDFSGRSDEIGDLSSALADMTAALWRRMDAIERFAADVAHEIKNPLSSLRSAVETATRVADPVKQRRLMAIILDDVQRLDRLISDISDASRLDAEMNRLEREPVALAPLLETLVSVHEATRADDGVRLAFRLEPAPDPALTVLGKEIRLAQVFRNLIANALSFSPEGGLIAITGAGRDGDVVIDIDDQGPGIPPGKFDAIFDRFYSERPAGEKFGTHSGLGLSISKQIIEAHGGRISAENRLGPDGAVAGARFRVRLPMARRAS